MAQTSEATHKSCFINFRERKNNNFELKKHVFILDDKKTYKIW